MLNLLFFLSCTQTKQEVPVPQNVTASEHQKNQNFFEVVVQKSTVIPNASAYYAADLNGDNIDEKIYYDSTGLRTPRGLEQVEGGFQVALYFFTVSAILS